MVHYSPLEAELGPEPLLSHKYASSTLGILRIDKMDSVEPENETIGIGSLKMNCEIYLASWKHTRQTGVADSSSLHGLLTHAECLTVKAPTIN
ncbi:hypothetical protein NM688_g7016 [Phlebia brevispora]|uniref:Uncharacterized protein n=1 Tax=Phlebia brevispora TaxID=194682 RepID=A0ACC1SAC7_9APHY|nr:hypothetical protein NM688_g7016 [Phlebia brevispora]